MPVNSKRKGKDGELELAGKLREHGYNVRRSVQYNTVRSVAKNRLTTGKTRRAKQST